MANYT